MKLSTYRWNVVEDKDVRETPIYYYGFKTKKSAKKFADDWNAWHETKIHIVDTERRF